MTDYEIERALGYTPCVCGVLDGTWHPACYRGKSSDQILAARKCAISKARGHLKRMARDETRRLVEVARRCGER